MDFSATVQGVQTSKEIVQRVLRVHILTPGRRRHEQPGFRFSAEQVVEEVQRLAIAPLEVVGNEEEWGPRRGGDSIDGVEESLPLVTLRQRLRPRQARHRGEEFGEQAGEFGQACPVESSEAGLKPLGAQPRDHRPVGDRALRGIRARLGGDCSTMDTP